MKWLLWIYTSNLVWTFLASNLLQIWKPLNRSNSSHILIDREEEAVKYHTCKRKNQNTNAWPYYPQFQTYIESSNSVFNENGKWAFIRNSCFNPSENTFILVDGSNDDAEQLSSIFSTFNFLIIIIRRAMLSRPSSNNTVIVYSSFWFSFYLQPYHPLVLSSYFQPASLYCLSV